MLFGKAMCRTVSIFVLLATGVGAQPSPSTPRSRRDAETRPHALNVAVNSIPATSATMGAVSGQIESDVAAHYFPPRPKEELAPGLTYQPVGPLNLLDIVPKQLRFQVSTGQVLVVTPFPGQAPRTQKSSPVF